MEVFKPMTLEPEWNFKVVSLTLTGNNRKEQVNKVKEIRKECMDFATGLFGHTARSQYIGGYGPTCKWITYFCFERPQDLMPLVLLDFGLFTNTLYPTNTKFILYKVHKNELLY